MKLIAITLGDVNGVGPEVTLKAAYHQRRPANHKLVLIGDGRILRQQAEILHLPVPPSWSPEGGKPPSRKVVLWNPAPDMRLAWRPGKIRVPAARAAVEWIRSAVKGCQAGWFDAMVTAPICKEGLFKAGLKMPGHTEFLATLTHTRRFAMMLMGDVLRVVLVTRHIPLRRVASHLTQKDITEHIQLSAEALPWLGIPRGPIGVCGLNPHAGDGGAIGSEEKDIIAPAIRAARRRGFSVEGPVPPDVIFHKALHGAYAVVVAMYHDQGLGPLKMLAFDRGINVTLGLPIARTSPDHGTAFDIAGEGKANPASMIEAVKLAFQLAGRGNPWA